MNYWRLFYILPLLPFVFVALIIGFVIHSAVQGFRKGWLLADKF